MMIQPFALVVGLAVSPPLPPSQPLQVAAPASLTADEQVLFDEAEQALQKFAALRLELPVEADVNTWAQALGQGLQAQAQAMVDLQTRYARLTTSARPEIAIPAQVRAGEVLEKFAAELAQVAVPSLPDPASQKQVAAALVEGAKGIRQGARSYYQAAVDRAQALGFTGDWVDFARARVAELDKEVVPPPPPAAVATEAKGREHPPYRR